MPKVLKFHLNRNPMKKYFVTLLLALLSMSLFAQNREYIRSQIQQRGECRNVAITKYNGDLMLYGRNGWAADGCPKDLTDALRELNNSNKYINDVQLTDQGCWLILYGDNGLRWNDIPYSLETKLREWNTNGEEITSVSFNDAGQWIIISKKYIAASDASIQDWIVEGMDLYDGVLATCMTDDAIVVVYEGGYKFLGNVPDDLIQKLKTIRFNVYRVKIAGTAWFISDNKSMFSYNM